MGYFPLFIETSGTSVLIIGAGNIAMAKLETLVQYFNNISILSERFNLSIKKLASNKMNIKLIHGPYNKSYITNFDIIISATGNKQINKQIAEEAKKLNKLVNIVDEPEISKFIFGAVVRRGNLSVASSTNGISPVLARLIKQKVEKVIPENLSDIDEFILQNRNTVKKHLSNLQARRLFWQEVIEGQIGEDILQGNILRSQQNIETKLKKTKNTNQAALYLIGTGPGDPDLITLKAINLISKADVILYDRLVSKQILNYARKEATKIYVGKTKGSHIYSQSQINEEIQKHLQNKQIVARLKGGDPTIFAHFDSESAIAQKLNVPLYSVPGITSALGAANYSGIPLTLRNKAKSVRFITVYNKDHYSENYWKELALTTDTLVFYMSSGNAAIIVRNLLKYEKNKSTGIAVIEQATTKYQKTHHYTLEHFQNRDFISPSIIIIGSVVNAKLNYNTKEETCSGYYFEKIEKTINNYNEAGKNYI